mgnify:CR=1 FL=1
MARHAGRFRERFTILRRRTLQHGPLREPVYEFEPCETVWGELGDPAGGETHDDPTTQPRHLRRATLTIRSGVEVRTVDRIRTACGTDWEIDDVRDPDRRREVLRLELRRTE